MLALWLLVTAALGAPSVGQVTPASPHYALEEDYHLGRYREGLASCEALLREHPEDPNLAFMRFRFRFELGESGFSAASDQRERLAYYRDMLAQVEEGLRYNPGDPHLVFCRSLGLGRLATTEGVMASLFSAAEIESDLLYTVNSGLQYRSIAGEEDVPSHPLLALGIFYRLVPDWWIVEVVAGVRGDLDKSLAYLQRADAAAPGQIQVLKELGVTEVCMGQQRDDARRLAHGLETLRTVATMPARIPTDRVDLTHVSLLLQDPSRACDYSRDGYQDRARASLESPAPP
ncbi:MAG: hypothetical protein JXX28_14185 [Deltaproteobacteria bacterium]|nr:hypothetical protein [Deltaproteobacteria bacterium]